MLVEVGGAERAKKKKKLVSCLHGNALSQRRYPCAKVADDHTRPKHEKRTQNSKFIMCSANETVLTKDENTCVCVCVMSLRPHVWTDYHCLTVIPFVIPFVNI